jgi:hypothetical protein
MTDIARHVQYPRDINAYYHQLVHDCGFTSQLAHTMMTGMTSAAAEALAGEPLFPRGEEIMAWRDGSNDLTLIYDAADGLGHRAIALLSFDAYPPNTFLAAVISGKEGGDADWFRDTLFAGLPAAIPAPPPPDDSVRVTFTYGDDSQAVSYQRVLTAPSWQEIRGNYAPAAAARLEKLIATGPAGQRGKVGVLHGVPGSGKTTFLRSLFREWKDKTVVTVILDPDVFFADARYARDVILEESGRCHLLVFEDAETHITTRENGKNAGLGQLLNLGDGLVGQGLDLQLLFTTNALRNELDPAVVRPGRCFLNAEIPAFSAQDAAVWLKEHASTAVPDGELTLAQMYELLAGETT